MTVTGLPRLRRTHLRCLVPHAVALLEPPTLKGHPVQVHSDHLGVKISGAPGMNVALQEVGLAGGPCLQRVGEPTVDGSDPGWRLRPWSAVPRSCGIAYPQSSMTGPAEPNFANTIAFYPEGLLHKFGFGDGDMLGDLTEEHDLGVDHRELLVAVVDRLVVPRLDQKVDAYAFWGTLHNPIRARAIDGVEADIGDTLTPEIIEIPVADIIEVARSLPPSDDPETWAGP